MKIFSLTILLSLAILGLAACDGSNSNTANVNMKTNVNGMTVNSNQAVLVNSNSNMMNSNMMNSNTNMSNSTSNLNSGATDFMKKAAQGGMEEVELGKLAATKGANQAVKDFGNKMVTDHSKANDELKALAAKKTITLPTEMDAKQKTDMDDLSKLSGAAFDSKYVKMMVEDHEKDVADFQKEADTEADADVKAFAAKTLPTLKEHLDMIKGIQSKKK